MKSSLVAATSVLTSILLASCASQTNMLVESNALSFSCSAKSGDEDMRSVSIASRSLQVSGVVGFGESKGSEGDQAVGVVDIQQEGSPLVAKLWMHVAKSPIGASNNVYIVLVGLENNSTGEPVGLFPADSKGLPFSVKVSANGQVIATVADKSASIEVKEFNPTTVVVGCHSLDAVFSHVSVISR